MTLFGLFDISLWLAIAVTLILTHITIVSVTVFLHRAQAHRALELHPALNHIFRLWLWLSTGMITKEWVALHRKHHAKCETPEDPHSPQILGLIKVIAEGAELYRNAASDKGMLARYGHGTPDDWLERHIYSRYQWQGVGLMLILDVLLFGLAGPIIWAIQMLWIPFWAAGVINGVGHYWGYRNFETPDAATNISPWGIIIGGEVLHNNHHAFPSSARLSSKWWEFDIGWMYIRSFELLGLAKVKKVAPSPRFGDADGSLDMDTLRAVIVSRMHVFARYSKDVLAPVTKAELCRSERHCRRLTRKTSKLLVLEGPRLDEVARQRLEQILAQSQTLATVYQFRERLRDIWERRAPDQEALLRSLQEWCQQAETTGINALENFARNLRGLSLHQAH